MLFVGTKRQAQEIVQEEARRASMYHVTNRWLGGTLTNFRTIKGGLDRLRTLERMREDGTHEQLPKKEVVQLEKERARLEKDLAEAEGWLAAARSRLANEAFMSKAPPNVVEGARAREAELADQVDRLRDRLERLGD